MKKFWILVVLAAVIGSTCAWAVNHSRHGKRTARFGVFTMDGEVTPENFAEVLSNEVPLGKAKAELDGPPEHDFGMLPPGGEGEHSFLIRNVGTDQLTLRLGATTCKCTLGELENESLAPGEETEIKLSWTVKSGDSAAFQQSAQLITNDPENIVINLLIKGTIIDQVSLVPETWSFGEVATGQEFELSGKIYSFMEHDIKSVASRFSHDSMTDLAEFTIEEFTPTEDSDGIRASARQGFQVNVKMKQGLRQGPVSQNLFLDFTKLDEHGEELVSDSDLARVRVPVKGEIVGPLSMIVNSKLTAPAGGGYVYDFGRLPPEGPFKATALIVLKGSEKDNTQLTIGEVLPAGIVKASLGKPKGRGSMVLYPLEIELVPGTEPIERLGKNKDDYGAIWIESDNPKVSKMRVTLKFGLPAQ